MAGSFLYSQKRYASSEKMGGHLVSYSYDLCLGYHELGGNSWPDGGAKWSKQKNNNAQIASGLQETN